MIWQRLAYYSVGGVVAVSLSRCRRGDKASAGREGRGVRADIARQ